MKTNKLAKENKIRDKYNQRHIEKTQVSIFL